MDGLLSFDPETGLAGLFLASFLSATLLPGGSEAVLFAVAHRYPEQAGAAFLLATLGNTLGGMATYAMSRALPERAYRGLPPGRLEQVRRWGSPALVMAWAPLVGDALCVAAGWLRLRALPCALWMAAGKGARYAAVIWFSGAAA